MRHERLVWVANRIAIVSSCAWTLLACSSKGFAPSNPSPASDAGPSPCTVTTAAAPACVLIVEPLQVDGGDAGDEDAGDLDASTASDGDAPDATVLAYDASCPITTTSEIQCGDVSYELNAAANTTGEAYASIVEPLYASSGTYATQLVDLKPDGTGTTSLEPVPRSENMRAVVVSNADGTPGIVGERSQTDLRYYTQSGGGWTAENIPGTAETAFSLNGAASSKSGQVFALLVNDAQHASILTRAASGGWTAGAPIAIAGADTSTLALDVEGVPYVLGVGYDSSGTTSGFWLSTGSAPPVSFSGPSELAEGAMLAIAGAAGAQKDALAFVQNYSESTIDLYDATDRDAQRTP
ncbi:MAG: hypothetical protein ACREJX_00640, partial [Polyangiaceae bacterium]